MSESVNIGRTIVRERRRAGVTQEALAAHLGVSKAAVSKWELGQSLPDVSLLPRIAAYFSLTLDELFDWRDELSQEESAALYAEVYALGEKNLATAHKRLRALATEHYRKLGRDDEAIELLQAERLRAASFVLSSLMQEVGMRDDAAFARVAGNAAEVVFEALDMGTVNPFFSATMSLVPRGGGGAAQGWREGRCARRPCASNRRCDPGASGRGRLSALGPHGRPSRTCPCRRGMGSSQVSPSGRGRIAHSTGSRRAHVVS